MAKDGDDKGLDEHTRIGVVPPKLPGAPTPPAPPAQAPPAQGPTAAPPPPASAPDEHTQFRATPPPIAPRPAAPATPPPSATPAEPPPAPSESTRFVAKPPPIPKAPQPGATAPTVQPPIAPPPSGDFEEHTILLSDLQKQALPAARMQRMAPPGRSDIVNLDRTHYLMGRLPSCDFRLYSQTASREHAQLTVRDGRWYLTPVTGKVVLVNGTQVKEEVPLTHKMRLQLGGDELVYLDESGVTEVREEPRASVASIASAASGDNRWLLVLIGVLTLAAVLWLWASR